MPDRNEIATEEYLLAALEKAGVLKKCKSPSSEGMSHMIAMIVRFTPSAEDYQKRDEIVAEADEVSHAANTLLRYLEAQQMRSDEGMIVDFRSQQLAAYGIDVPSVMVLIEKLKCSAEKASRHHQIIYPTVKYDEKTKIWHQRATQYAGQFCRMMESTNPGFTERHNNDAMCKFLACVMGDVTGEGISFPAVRGYIGLNPRK